MNRGSRSSPLFQCLALDQPGAGSRLAAHALARGLALRRALAALGSQDLIDGAHATPPSRTGDCTPCIADQTERSDLPSLSGWKYTSRRMPHTVQRPGRRE